MPDYKIPLTAGKMTQFPVPAGLVLGLFLVAIYKLFLRAYRVHWHPLKSFKSLPEACVSEDWLYQITKDGKAEEKLEALHEKYSMAISFECQKLQWWT